ncbi:MAG: lipoate--protein ligase family protein [Chloroflexota bacterium]|nr:lipoate--protein ligase family protein [Chloroflexota bacterium]
MTLWRLLCSPPATGARNMAVDEALLRSTLEDPSLRTLRLYTWDPACYSIGRFQRAVELNERARLQPGSTWVRRPTGGRALYHGPELTYSLIAPVSEPLVSGTVLESYRKIAEPLLVGLRLLGVQVTLAPPRAAARGPSDPSCFNTASAYELTWRGRKLVGSAQYRHHHVLLQHGSILLDDPSERLVEGLEFAGEAERQAALEVGRARLATMQEALGRTIQPREVAGAVAQSFAECWALDPQPSGLTQPEEDQARGLEREQYSSLQWSYLR